MELGMILLLVGGGSLVGQAVGVLWRRLRAPRPFDYSR
jgi:hypothetical protein